MLLPAPPRPSRAFSHGHSMTQEDTVPSRPQSRGGFLWELCPRVLLGGQDMRQRCARAFQQRSLHLDEQPEGERGRAGRHAGTQARK